MSPKPHVWLTQFPLILLFAALIAGCNATPIPQAVSTLAPTALVAVASTAVAATVTPIGALTRTPGATHTPEASPTIAPPTPTPIPAEPINPFTGLTLTQQVASHIPLLIKVSNSPQVVPQTGLALADVVMEHYSEGGITRFTALYLTNTPEKVGSVRSCRLIDIELVVIYGAGEVCSGTSGGVRQVLKQSKSWEGSGGVVSKTVWMISDLGTFECQRQVGCKLPMFRTPDMLPPHNLYANAQNALKELQIRGKDKPTTFSSWTFSSTPPVNAEPARVISIPYTTGAVTWMYNATAGVWLRAMGGRPHTEKLTGKQLGVENVIVLYANHVNTPIIENTGGSHSIEVQLWGDGPATIFRDGEMIQGRWQRTGNAMGLAFVDSSGHAIDLKPGHTWIEFAPLNMVVKIS
jgi:Protein of unknown function (DUF3048) N-terminal domain/Protein of unknown function (DUF3048) C-terminal domain